MANGALDGYLQVKLNNFDNNFDIANILLENGKADKKTYKINLKNKSIFFKNQNFQNAVIISL